MINKIKALEKLSRLLEPEVSQREKWNSEVLDYTNNFINKLDTTNAFFHSEENSKNIYNFDIEEQATELSSLLDCTTKSIDEVGINAAFGGHLGYIPGGGLYPSALGDYIAAVTNRYAGVFDAAPGAVRLENMLIRWMCRLMNYPENAAGNLTSGGSIANLIALVTAREAHNIKARDFDKSVIYLSEQAHHSIFKAIRIAGLSEAPVRYIHLDENFRLSADELEKAIIKDKENGMIPFFINASFGTTNTGAIDPIASIANIAKKHKLWVHVDAAYGGSLIFSETHRNRLNGIQHVDSLTVDFHKLFFQRIFVSSDKKT